MISWKDLTLEFPKAPRPVVLDIAEGGELGDIVLMGTLPGLVVGKSPQFPVIGRARIRKERDRIVGPDPGITHLRTPALHPVILVLRHLDQIGLHKGNVPFGLNESVSKLVRRHFAALFERIAALGRETFDSALD